MPARGGLVRRFEPAQVYPAQVCPARSAWPGLPCSGPDQVRAPDLAGDPRLGRTPELVGAPGPGVHAI
jgi:hypothetical protein